MHALVGSVVLGHPGRPRSRSMPSASHQAESRLSPSSPLLLAKGGPLSLRIASGRPWCSKSRSKQIWIVSVRAFSTARISRSMRLCSSLTVSGSTRWPLRIPPPSLEVHSPDIIGGLGLSPRRKPPALLGRRRLRGLVRPARSRTRLKLLSLGSSPLDTCAHRALESCAAPNAGGHSSDVTIRHTIFSRATPLA